LIHLGADGFFEFRKTWDAVGFPFDNPLCDEEGKITTDFRVPWIRRNATLFLFDPQAEH
jgi:hypothetical protein